MDFMDWDKEWRKIRRQMDPFRDIRKSAELIGTAHSFQTSIDLFHRKNDVLKNALGLAGYKNPMDTPNILGVGHAMAEFQRSSIFRNDILKSIRLGATITNVEQPWQKAIRHTGLIPNYDPLHSLRSSLTQVSSSFSVVADLQTNFDVVDSLFQKSILSLNSRETRELYNQVVEIIEERELTEEFPEEELIAPNTRTTPALRNTCYRLIMGLLVTLIGVGVPTEEIQSLIDYLFTMLERLTLLMGLTEGKNKMEKQPETPATPIEPKQEIHHHYHITVKSEEEANEWVPKEAGGRFFVCRRKEAHKASITTKKKES